MGLKHTLRRRLGPGLQWLGYRTGIMAATGLRGRADGAIVLMYHSVAADEDARWIDPRNHVPAAVFEQQMAFLKAHKNVVPLAVLVDAIRGGEDIETGTVVITFDDGYLDNLTVAAPILARFELPATIFLPTGYIDRGETQWVDEIYTAFKHRRVQKLEWPEGGSRAWRLDEPSEHDACYQRVCEDLLTAGPAQRRRLLDTLRARLEPSVGPPRLTMTWGEVRRLVDSAPVTLGGHTVEHTDLTSRSVAEAESELVAASDRIREATGIEPKHFSFCYGRSSAELRTLLPGLGVEAAFASTASDRFVTQRNDPLFLPRIAASADVRRFPLALHPANRGLWRKLGR